METKDINISHKGADGKYKTVVSITQGMYGPRVGVNTQRLKALLDSDNEWENLSVFENDPKVQPKKQEQPKEEVKEDLSDEIPF